MDQAIHISKNYDAHQQFSIVAECELSVCVHGCHIYQGKHVQNRAVHTATHAGVKSAEFPCF